MNILSLRGHAREIAPLRETFYRTRRAGHGIFRTMQAGFALQTWLLPTERLDRLIEVETSAVQAYTAPHHWPRRQRGFVLSGDWDRTQRFDLDGYYRESRNYRSTLQIFADGVPYYESDQYLWLRDRILAGDRRDRCRTIEELDHYFRHLQEIFDSIRTHGYRTQRELGLATRTFIDEVKIVIDRDGALLRAHGGNHRFAMARVLELPTLPVLVSGVHEAWAKRCFERYGPDLLTAVQRGIDELDRSDQPTELAA